MTIDGSTLTVGHLFGLGPFQPARVQREFRRRRHQQRQLFLELCHRFRSSEPASTIRVSIFGSDP